MQREDSSYPADWLRIAERDWNRVPMLLDEGDVELAGFCLQQAMEKLLKAFLLSYGWQLRRTHNLDALLDDAITFDSTLEKYRDMCQKITAFYVVERYPFTADFGIEQEDVRGAFDQVKELIEKLRKKIAVRDPRAQP